jgi:hypothetical protein
MPLRKSLALLAAAAALAGVALQFEAFRLRMGEFGVAAVLWRLLGFFTILSNLGAAATGLAVAFRPGSVLAGRRARLAAAVCVAVAGFVYAVALRGQWRASGIWVASDHLMHDASPILFLALWFVARDGALAWRDALYVAAAPALYFIYALARGAIDGWYAYWFLDPTKLSLPLFVLSAAILLTAFILAGLALIAIDRKLAMKQNA